MADVATGKRVKASADVALLETARLEHNTKGLAEAQRLALHHARKAGEAEAHGDVSIAATLARLAEHFLKQALEHYLEVKAGALIRADHRKRYGQKHSLKKSGRPRGGDLGAVWLKFFDEKLRTSHGQWTKGEIHEDIVEAHRQMTGTKYSRTYVAKKISEARSALKSEKQKVRLGKTR